MNTGQVYKTAFLTLQDRVKNGVKTTYGKNELLSLMAEVFIDTVNKIDDGNPNDD